MCEVMPTISEGDSAGPPRGTGGVPNGSEQEANFEQLMVNMLDERDKLLESLRETQETLIQCQAKLQGALHERDMLQRQINAALPQVSEERAGGLVLRARACGVGCVWGGGCIIISWYRVLQRVWTS